MSDALTTFLTRYSNEICMACLGMLGGSVRIAVGMTNSEKMPPSQMFAILVTGAVLAATSANLFAGLFGLGPGSTSLCSFIVGIMGMNIVKHAMDMDVGAFIFKERPKQ